VVLLLRCTGAMLFSGLVWGLGALAMFPAEDPLLQACWLVLRGGPARSRTR
jgi:hypothetical protein